MADGNFIQINRSILEWEWYKDINTKVLFFHCLLKANWKEGKFKGNVIERGSFVSSIGSLASELDMTNDEIRTALKHLEKTGELTKQTTNKYTVFTVVNYDLYQNVPKQTPSESQANPNQIPTYSQSIPNNRIKKEGNKEIKKEGNKDKKEDTNVSKKKGPAVYFADEKLNQTFLDFIEMRKSLKKPMSDRAIRMMITKLEKMSVLPFSDTMDNDYAVQVLEKSILKSWTDIWPLDDEKSRKRDSVAEVDNWA